MGRRTNLKTSVLMAVILLGLGCTIAAGEVIYVDVDAPGPIHDGRTWGRAYKYLQDALAVAATDDDIWVAEGTYKPDEDTVNTGGTNSRRATFQLINGVGIYGGFPSGGGEWYDHDPKQYETILSGDINTPGDNSDNSYHVVTGSGTDATTVIDGFTITAGNANGSNPYNKGGGMHNSFALASMKKMLAMRRPRPCNVRPKNGSSAT